MSFWYAEFLSLSGKNEIQSYTYILVVSEWIKKQQYDVTFRFQDDKQLIVLGFNAKRRISNAGGFIYFQKSFILFSRTETITII